MSNKLDTVSQETVIKGLAPIAVSDNTAQVSDTIDIQGYDAIKAVLMSGVLADVDATFAVQLFEGDASNMSDEAAVSSSDSLYGTVANWTFADDNAVQQFGYRGSKRYLRVKITPSNNTGSAVFSVAFLGRKKKIGTI